MKYFKVTDLATKETHYVSTRCSSTGSDIVDSALLDPRHEYEIKEVSSREYFLGPQGLFAKAHDPDIDEEWEDDDDEYWD